MARVLPHNIIFVNANQMAKAKVSPPPKRLCLPKEGWVPPRQQQPPKREPSQQPRPQPCTQPRRPNCEGVEFHGKPTVDSNGGLGVVLVMSLGIFFGGCAVRKIKTFTKKRFQTYIQKKVDKCVEKTIGKHEAEVRDLQGTVLGLQQKIDVMQAKSWD